MSLLTALLALSGTTLATPITLTSRDITPSLAPTINSPFPIHSSCNASEVLQLASGLEDTILLARTAAAHLLKHGHESPIVQKYFGNETTATPLGWYQRVLDADRGNMTFRCDDPDRNCETQEGWAGHWRGENATTETVICPLSFLARYPLTTLCTRGYTVSASPQNLFWATDLLHRILHVPTISEGLVDHYSEDYASAVALKETMPGKTGIDSDVLQFFAVEVYGWEVAAPGVGCVGDSEREDQEGSTATETIGVESSATTTAKTECHTHADGTEHCV